MMPTCQCLILTGIADEQRVIVDGMHHMSTVVFDPFVRDAGTTEKMECVAVLGKLYCVQLDDRWTPMIDFNESFDRTQIIVSEDCGPKVCTADFCTAEVCTAEVCTDEVCTAEVCIVEVCTAEVCTDEV